MIVETPYLLFIGDAQDQLSIKLAQGVADWKPELAVGEWSIAGNTVTTGLKEVSLDEGVELGAKTLVLGFTNSGGIIDEKWVPYIVSALQQGLDVASGLHQKLNSIARIKTIADEMGRKLIDVRHPQNSFETGKGKNRTGKRLLTVGTDCSVGKMYTALAIEKYMLSQGRDVSFKATGQCGIFIAGEGVAIDCVISDFIAGAVEQLSPNNHHSHWDIIEGQGSLFHPSFAGVSLGLIHGAQPDAIVVCHAAKREHMRGVPEYQLPSVKETININLQHARLTNPDVKCVGVAINTSMLTIDEANTLCQQYQNELNLPCVDPLRHGVQALVESL